MILSLALAEAALAQPGATPATAVTHHFELLDPATVRPDQMLPPPPATGSTIETIELAEVRQVIASASPERMVQARSDDAHEDPSIFDAAMGRRLADLPATWALLLIIQHETDGAIDLAKKHFGRIRPWGVDPALPNCDAGKGKAARGSYPSGHSGLGYAVGWTLAELVPAKAQAFLARAADYALSREICGVHFPSDIEASHVVGTLIAARLLADPRLAPRIAAARAELVVTP